MDLLPSIVGGVLIGLSASLLLLSHGRVAGVSGIAGGLFSRASGERAWRVAFLAGLVGAGALLSPLLPHAFGSAPAGRGPGLILLAGVLVGAGSQLGSGCTSGHGVCGLARGSRRSLAATLTFMAVGVLTAVVVGSWLGGRP